MPLLRNYIEGTQLNRLKYDNFSVGKEPIVQKRIPTGINERGPSSNEISKRADDLKRIATVFTRSEGIKYALNESVLAQVRNKPTIPGVTEKQSLLSKFLDGTFSTVKVLGSTLAQVPLNGTGTHFVKGFADRSGYLPRSYAAEVNKGALVDTTDVESANLTINKNSRFNTGYFLNDQKKDLNEDIHTTPFEFKEKQGERKEFAKESRVSLGDISARTKEERKSPYEKNPIPGKFDEVNALSPTKERKSTGDPEEARDLAKFNFQIIEPGETGQQPNITYLYFRALLDDISDAHNGSWGAVNYLGRSETLYNYLNYDRTISLSFKVAAMTRHELKPIYQKLTWLVSSTAGNYSSGGFKRGTLTRLTVGSLFYELPGFIESVNLSWNNTYPWEIALNSPDPVTQQRSLDSDVQELPTVLDVQLNYTVIHDFNPQTGYNHYLTNSVTNPFFAKNEQI